MRTARGSAMWIVVIATILLVVPSGAVAAEKPACNIASPTGQRLIQLNDQGASRPFILQVPAEYRRRKPAPLILDLHASGSSGALQLPVGGLDVAADRRGYAVAAPNGAVIQGGSYFWNVPGVPLVSGQLPPAGTPDDERYLLRVIKAAKKAMCVDPDRIYIVGLSGGARMASQMACDNSEVFAAIAPVVGLRAGVPVELSDGVWAPDSTTCKTKSPVSVVTFHGTADDVNPYPGSDDPRWGYSVEQALAGWVKNDRCKSGPSRGPVTPTVELVTYGSCKDKGAVTLYRVLGGGHNWPGAIGSGSGVVDQSISATDLMLQFFSRHTLKQR